MSVLDIVVLIIIGLGAITGAIKGLFNKASGLISLLCAAVVAYFASTPLNNLFISNGYYQSMYDSIGYDTTNLLMFIVVFIVIFIICFIVVKLIFKALNSAFESIGFLKVINKLLGLVFGAALSLALCCIILYFLGWIGNSVTSFNDWLQADLDKSFGLARGLFDFAYVVVDEIKVAIS